MPIFRARHFLTALLFAAPLLCGLVANVQADQRPSLFGRSWYCPTVLLKRTPLPPGFLESVRLSPSATLEEIRTSWVKVRKAIWADEFLADPYLDARRLINASDWEDALRDTPRFPLYKYGVKPIRNFYALTIFVRTNASGKPVDAHLLRLFHRLAMRDLPFHGFEGRRLLQRHREGKITSKELKQLLRRAYEKNEEIAGVSHDSLRGKFRSDPIDEIEHRGSSFDEFGSRFFTAEELAAHRANPFLRVDEASIRVRAGGGYTGIVRYYPVADVARAVEHEIDQKMEIITNLYDSHAPIDKIVAMIVELEKNLISLHPFLDGNGRVIRALSDLIYSRVGLPPPLRPNENDLLYTTLEAVEYSRKEMIESVNEWIRILEGPL